MAPAGSIPIDCRVVTLYGQGPIHRYGSPKMAESGPEKLVFVGGAPRSGTTVTHALICTSERVNDYHPEISFFRGIPSAYRNGKVAWDGHTSALFSDRDEFRGVMRRTADVSLDHVWRRLGKKPVLCMKDPHLTPFFPDLHELYPQEAWFVTVCRHPFDVVRSRQEVHEKTGLQQPFGADLAMAVAREYLAYYRAVLTTDFAGRHFMFRYEDLNAEAVRNGLAQVAGVDDLDVRKLWGAAPDTSDDPWGSPKYNGPIDLEPRLTPLAPALREAVRPICQPIMARFDYQ
jgi:hypothetical protein